MYSMVAVGCLGQRPLHTTNTLRRRIALLGKRRDTRFESFRLSVFTLMNPQSLLLLVLSANAPYLAKIT